MASVSCTIIVRCDSAVNYAMISGTRFVKDERWSRIDELVEQAETLGAQERREWLERAEPDAALREEVLALIEAMAEEQAAARHVKPAKAVLPERIGEYRIEDQIGSGGRSVVYRGVKQAAGVERTVAVKVMLDHVGTAADLERFRREQRILAGLHQHGIVEYLDGGIDERGRPYLVMEWVDGETLDRYVERIKPERRAIVDLVMELLEILAAAHEQLVVHLDLKPTNVLVDTQGRLRIIDFGTAKWLAGEGSETLTRQLTPRYASPEQWRGEPVGIASDLYSVGLILYELLTGRPLFPASSALGGWMARATAGPVEVHLPGDRDLEAILRKALAEQARERYRGSLEFLRDLEAWRDKRPVAARKGTALYRLRRFVRRNTVAVVVAAVSVVGLAGLGIYAWQQQAAKLREAERFEATSQYLNRMIARSSVSQGGRTGLSVLEMIERAHREIEQGLGPPDEVAARLQGNFAYVAKESGRDELAREMALAAVRRSDATGLAVERVVSRRMAAEMEIRLGRCAEAKKLYEQTEGLLGEVERKYLPLYWQSRADYLQRCEGKLNEALAAMEGALRLSQGLTERELGAPVPILRASQQNVYAAMLMRAGRLEDARKAVRQGIAATHEHRDGLGLRLALLRTGAQAEALDQQHVKARELYEQAIGQGRGFLTEFELARLELMAAMQTARAGEREMAVSRARAVLAGVEGLGKARWMVMMDGGELLAEAGLCVEAEGLFQAAEGIAGGTLPRDWMGNRLSAMAFCVAPRQPKVAAELAERAIETYGGLLRPESAKAKRLRAIAGGR